MTPDLFHAKPSAFAHALMPITNCQHLRKHHHPTNNSCVVIGFTTHHGLNGLLLSMIAENTAEIFGKVL